MTDPFRNLRNQAVGHTLLRSDVCCLFLTTVCSSCYNYLPLPTAETVGQTYGAGTRKIQIHWRFQA